MVPGSIPCKLFFHKNYSEPPKKAGLGLGQTFQNCLTFIYIKISWLYTCFGSCICMSLVFRRTLRPRPLDRRSNGR